MSLLKICLDANGIQINKAKIQYMIASPNMNIPKNINVYCLIVNCLEQVVTVSTRDKSFLNLLFIDNTAVVDHLEVREPLGCSDHYSVFARPNVHLFFSKLRVFDRCSNPDMYKLTLKFFKS